MFEAFIGYICIIKESNYMKVIRAFCLCWLLMLAGGVSAQLVDKVLSVLGEDSVGSVTVARTDSDSIQLSLVRQ